MEGRDITKGHALWKNSLLASIYVRSAAGTCSVDVINIIEMGF
jgi:hypothetical protein